ncbi:hypothetical protein CW705_02625 [Candidatus Bathyarchaeota archaeon]|nr:MAG: hypothetical protein CW705_02625 [Candidatus Bathyarchaeota archaeon]
MSSIAFPNPFNMQGSWFKGNLHTHTTNSDGLLTPSQIAFLYKANGYDFLSITDHGKLTNINELSESLENLIILPGEEIAVGNLHLAAFNIKEEIRTESNPQKIIDEVSRQGGEVIIAHPYWSALTLKDLLEMNGYLGIEIYNATCDVSVAKGYSTVYWDNMLYRGIYTYGFAVDDAHGGLTLQRPTDTCKGWIMVKADRLNRESLMESLRSGLFYSSTGPEIHDVQIRGEEIRVKTSPVQVINFLARNGLGRRFFASDKPIDEATYTIKGNEGYIRIEAEDDKGRTAWTNPIIIQGED